MQNIYAHTRAHVLVLICTVGMEVCVLVPPSEISELTSIVYILFHFVSRHLNYLCFRFSTLDNSLLEMLSLIWIYILCLF